MANNNNWGSVYCLTEFGEEDFTIAESVPAFSASACFVVPIVGSNRETLALTVDDIKHYNVDRKGISPKTGPTADLTLVTLFG